MYLDLFAQNAVLDVFYLKVNFGKFDKSKFNSIIIGEQQFTE